MKVECGGELTERVSVRVEVLPVLDEIGHDFQMSLVLVAKIKLFGEGGSLFAGAAAEEAGGLSPKYEPDPGRRSP